MYNDMKQLTCDFLIGNYVYECCLLGEWDIFLKSIYNWSRENELGIFDTDIDEFVDYYNFKIIDVKGDKAIHIPRGDGRYYNSDVERLRCIYREGLPTDIVRQIQQSMAASIPAKQTSIFAERTLADADNADMDLCKWTKHIGSRNYTASCGEDLVPLMRGYNFCPYCGRKLKASSFLT